MKGEEEKRRAVEKDRSEREERRGEKNSRETCQQFPHPGSLVSASMALF